VRTTVAVLLIALLAVTTGASAQSQRDMERRACADYQAAEKELGDVYAAVLARYAQDREFVAKFKRAQQAWATYRDAELAALYPSKNKQAAYGSAYETCYCGEQREMTVRRTEALRQWLSGVEEGNVCAGSRRVAD
jgi:uncharacterized protein YecT (DUF1311 family)